MKILSQCGFIRFCCQHRYRQENYIPLKFIVSQLSTFFHISLYFPHYLLQYYFNILNNSVKGDIANHFIKVFVSQYILYKIKYPRVTSGEVFDFYIEYI